jgi:adenylate cyclase
MEDRVATILFADLAGFTPLTERLEPRAVAALLNDFYRRMTEVIFRWGGTIDKFIGDAVMALFGAPVSRGDDPVRAVRCALAMREELEKMMAARPAGERCGLTVGIHTGRVLVGTVGSDARLEFTAIGDPVNTAARLQASAEAGQIVISQETLSQVGDRFHTRSLGERSLKGKDRPVVVHEVIEEETDINTLPGNAGAVEAARTRKDT